MKVNEERQKAVLKLKTHSENEDHGIWPHHFMAKRSGKVEQVTDFIFLASKSLRMVTTAMKLKDDCFLEEKL